jgi:hypothetical protein
MNKTIRALQFFNRKVKFEDYFYNISISKYDVTLQGNYNSEVSKKLFKMKFKGEVDKDYGYLIFKRNNIKVILT